MSLLLECQVVLLACTCIMSINAQCHDIAQMLHCMLMHCPQSCKPLSMCTFNDAQLPGSFTILIT